MFAVIVIMIMIVLVLLGAILAFCFIDEFKRGGDL